MLSEEEYKELIIIADKIINTDKKICPDITMTAHDIINDAYILAINESKTIIVTKSQVERFIIKSLNKDRYSFTKMNPEDVKKERNRISLYRKLHPEKAKEYIQKNREKINANAKKWRDNNPEKVALSTKRFHSGEMHFIDRWDDVPTCVEF